MHLVYIAGPYRAASRRMIRQNIHRAEDAGEKIVRKVAGMDVYPVIPHKNTEMMDGLAPAEYFLRGTMALLERCDSILMVDGWGMSSGATAELARAVELDMPAFRYWYDLAGYLRCGPGCYSRDSSGILVPVTS